VKRAERERRRGLPAWVNDRKKGKEKKQGEEGKVERKEEERFLCF